MKKGEFKVVVISHSAGINQGCRDCRKVLAEGKYALGLKIKYPNREHQYIIGVDPPVMCCGNDKKIWRLFESEDTANKGAKEVADYLNKHETTEGLRLFVTDLDF